jgi:hypothetical protein
MMENKEANGNLNFVHFSVVHEGVSPSEEWKEENEHNPAFLELHEETQPEMFTNLPSGCSIA